MTPVGKKLAMASQQLRPPWESPTTPAHLTSTYILTRIFGTCIKDRLLDEMPSGRTLLSSAASRVGCDNRGRNLAARKLQASGLRFVCPVSSDGCFGIWSAARRY